MWTKTSNRWSVFNACAVRKRVENYMDYVLIFNSGEFDRISPLCSHSEQTYSAIDRVFRACCLLSKKRTWTGTTVSSVSVVATVNVLSRFSKHDMAKCSFLWPDDDEVILSSEHSFRRPIICTIAIYSLYESLRTFRYLYMLRRHDISAKWFGDVIKI